MTKYPRVLVDIRGRFGSYATPLCQSAAGLLARLALEVGLGPDHELSLVLTDNPTIRQLNQRWRAIDQPTDVLSFPLYGLKPGKLPPAGPVGDIVISLPTTRRAALQEGVAIEYHLAWLLSHGLLHLIGYDHENDRDEARMRHEEKRLLAKEFAP